MRRSSFFLSGSNPSFRAKEKTEETQRFPGFPFVFNAFRLLLFCVYLAVIASRL
jgi:hypothetical protein